ncbi:MAG: hypothetical protein LBM19_03375 [Holosporales bacterium]|jgi:hypothetical protein|nr:hypothetical protein [Holosporales bacterium]
MTNLNNRNAYEGAKCENLIKDSFKKHLDIIEKIRKTYNIKGEFEETEACGSQGKKADVKIRFSCGNNIDVSVKSYRKKGVNQLTRISVSNFCEYFKLGENDRKDLEEIVVRKAKNSHTPLFRKEDETKWEKFFRRNAEKILKLGFSDDASKEILALFSREESMVRLYSMEDVLNELPKTIKFTRRGINVGNCISFQRKGGNGVKEEKPKTDIEHPGNNLQLKIKIDKFIEEMKNVLLIQYSISDDIK